MIIPVPMFQIVVKMLRKLYKKTCSMTENML